MKADDKKLYPSSIGKPKGHSYSITSPRSDAHRAEIRSILTGTPVRAKLRVGSPDDAYEREADVVADRVMRMPADEIRRKPT